MERTLLTTTFLKVWNAQHLGWKLTFTLETGNNTSVHCNGFKMEENSQSLPTQGQSGSVNAQLNPTNNGSSVSFNGTPHNSELAGLIIAEMEAILTEEAA